MSISLFLYIVLILFGSLYFLLIILGGRFMHYSWRGVVTKVPSPTILTYYDFEDVEFKGLEGNILRGWFVRGINNPTNRTLISRSRLGSYTSNH